MERTTAVRVQNGTDRHQRRALLDQPLCVRAGHIHLHFGLGHELQQKPHLTPLFRGGNDRREQNG